MNRLRKNDLVMVTVGKDKGRTGRVKSFVGEDRVVVERVNMIKRHRKPSKSSPGGIEEKESAIHVSNVMLVDPKTKERTRVRYSLKGNEKFRVAVKSGEVIG